MPRRSEYDILLDAIVPLEDARADFRQWDGERWGRTLRDADWHRLSPVLFCHLDARGGAPGAVRSALERAYLANAARSLFLAAALRRVVDALHGADVPALLLKGAALVETVYPDPAQREMLDLDILVPEQRLGAANAALAPLGYAPVPGSNSPEQTTMQLKLDEHHGPALVGEQQLLAVELHRHVAIAGEGNRFEIDGIWQRARATPTGAHLLPSPADLLLHVCVHFTRNRLGGSYRHRNTGGALGQILDIARVVQHEPLDWDALVASARSYRLDARVFLALFAARELGVRIPDDALAALQPTGFDPIVGRRLVALRVLRAGDHMPVRTLRWMFAPGREVLSRGWNADPTATLSLASAYMRRARANAPLARSALRRPWSFIQDQRLNGQIRALEERG
ncbi:MAG: nucleotidyltransferase family protein [Solirubrobacteraceae bacterium]|jgi:hypothetical protein